MLGWFKALVVRLRDIQRLFWSLYSFYLYLYTALESKNIFLGEKNTREESMIFGHVFFFLHQYNEFSVTWQHFFGLTVTNWLFHSLMGGCTSLWMCRYTEFFVMSLICFMLYRYRMLICMLAKRPFMPVKGKIWHLFLKIISRTPINTDYLL